MATKIRLQRHGRKGYAFYQIVVADSRAKRDGKCIERIGSYNPNTNPATIDLNFEKAMYWIGTGAQPTDTARNILSKEGVMMMNHLMGGVKKGAFTAEQAAEKFEAWKADKSGRVAAVNNKLATEKAAKAKARLEAEIEANKAKAEAVAAKLAAAAATEEVATEEATEETAAE
ncbi:MAG: 30S ribosomal protein S16 [Bacteroidales bacterium]